MTISAPQCRAGRALLDWSQDKLAESAGVARATIADFERNLRIPMRQNLFAIQSSLQAAGLAFIGEEDGGVGVRFRAVAIEYVRALRADDQTGGVSIPVRYRGQPYIVVIPQVVSENIDPTLYRTDDEKLRSISKHLPVYLNAAEEMLERGVPLEGNRIVLGWNNFPELH